MSILEAENIVRTYGTGKQRFRAVKGVSFEVGQGELVSLLGTNGAGKTSLVEVLEGLAAPTSGRVRLFGKDPIRDRRAVSPRTGIMLQEAGFAQDLTVGETLRMWAGTLSAPRPVDEALDWLSYATAPKSASSRSPAANGAASTSPLLPSGARIFCFLTSRRPAWTRPHAAAPGVLFRTC